MTTKPSFSSKSGCIVLLTKVKCPDCERFKPEWIKFLEFFEAFNSNGENKFPPDFIQHYLYNDSAIDAPKKRKEMLKYAEEGVDRYPVLLFYLGPEAYRWKPYWFNSAPFRTAPALIFSFLVLYRVAHTMDTVLRPHLYNDNEKEKEKKEKKSTREIDIKTKIDHHHRLIHFLPQVVDRLQILLDASYPEDLHTHPNYPTFKKVFTLYRHPPKTFAKQSK